MITPAEYSNGVTMAYVIVGAIRGIDLDAILAEMARAEALAPMIDPTLARQKMALMLEDKHVVSILARAKKDLEALPWPPADDAMALRARSRLPMHPGVPFAEHASDADATGDASRVLSGQGAL